MSLISVIVPVYKVEPYLRRCVDSVLAQTFRDFELILVDDGSPDNCGAICDDYARRDARVHVIHQPNGGLSAARNAALDWSFANSDSRYVTFIDSDDWVAQDYLERLSEKCDQYDVVCADYLAFEGAEPCVESEGGRYLILSPYLYWKLCGFAVTAWGKIYKKNMFAHVRFPVGKIHEDEYTIPQVVFTCDRVAYLQEKLYFYRQRTDGIMGRTFNERRLDVIEAKKNQVKLFAELGFFDLARDAQLSIFTSCEKAITVLGKTEYRTTLRKGLRATGIATLKYEHLYRAAFPFRAAFVMPIMRLFDSYLRLGFFGLFKRASVRLINLLSGQSER